MTGTGAGDTDNNLTGSNPQGPVLQGRDFHNTTFNTFQAAAAPLALAQLPAQAAVFTGRETELAEVISLLDPSAGAGAGAVVVSAVAGLAGVGKTALAIQAAHTALANGWFGGGVLFLDLHGYDDDQAVHPGQALDALLRALGISAEDIPPGAEDRAGLYRSVLATISDPVLIVADNASTETQVRPLLPGTGPHRVLVTSRHTLAGLGARLLDVEILDEQAGIALLEKALRAARPADNRITSDTSAAGRLAAACGGLPLALHITAALLIGDPVLTVSELADQLADEMCRLEALRYDDGGGTSAPSVAAAFELSYRQLDEIASRVFRLLPVNPGPDLSTTAAAVLADLPVSDARRVLGQLVRAHLIEAAAGAAGRWRMHDLLRLYARQLSDANADVDERERARDRLLEIYVETAMAAEAHLQALHGISAPANFTGRDSALAWLDAERSSLVAAVTMAANTGRDQIALGLAFFLNQYFAWRRNFDDQLTTAMISRDAARRLGDRVYEATTLTMLGMALQSLRRFEEAITAHQEAVVIFQEIGDRGSGGTVLNNLGAALREMRRFGEAITAHQEAVLIFQEIEDRGSEGDALNNLGAALGQTHRFEEAITSYQEAAAIYQEIGDRHSEGTVLNNLGLALGEVRGPEEAAAAHQEAAAIFRETEDRHGEGQALSNLGLALFGTRRFEEAITAQQEALMIFQETEDRHSQGVALSNLIGPLQRTRRFEEAFAACQEAAAIFQETDDRHSQGQALSNLGWTLREMRRFEEAITTCQEAAAIFQETGDRHGEGTSLNNLGAALEEVRRFEEAFAAYQEAVVIFQEIEDRGSEGDALNNLGAALGQTHRFEEAITSYQEAAAIYQEIGDGHRQGTVLNNLGLALAEVRGPEEAGAAHQEAAAIFREIDDRHGEGQALSNLGLALFGTRRFEEAITTCQKAAAIFQETDDRQGQGLALGNLGLALQEMGQLEEAVAAHQEAAAIFRETGDQHNENTALNKLKDAQARKGS